MTAAVAGGLAFPECPRWRDGALWFSDIATGTVHRLRNNGSVETIVGSIDRAAGLGWLPNGELLIAAGTERRLLRHDGLAVALHADLSGLAEHCCNDMLVDTRGRAWVGNWGFDYAAGETPRPASLLRVDADGSVHVAAGELMFPNGMAITPDGGTLIVAETFAARLTAFTIAPDGTLSDRRVWAALRPATADGICLDAAGAVWLASPTTGEVLRVLEGGAVTQRIVAPEQPLAVVLGGPDRRTLYIASSHLFDRVEGRTAFTGREQLRKQRRGRIDSVQVEVAGAGWP